MKIALLTDGVYPYVIGGMQKHSFYLTKYLALNKIFVDLYHTNQSAYDVSKLELFTEDEKYYIRSFVIKFPSFGTFPGHYIRESYEYSNRIFELFSENSEVDFIYAKGFTAWKLIDEKRRGYKCAPIGINFHGYEMFQKAASLRSKFQHVLLLRKPVIFNIEHADYLFSYGGKITNLIVGLGVKQEKIIESFTGIEEDWLMPEICPVETIRKFVFVGRYERRKGVEELTIVLNELALTYNFEFYFIGDIPDKKKMPLEKVKYLGKITDSERMKNILRGGDILVCPSYSEGMPNVILEAMASGLALIASDVGAVNKLVSGNNGWLINPGNKLELKSALVEAMQMPPLKIEEMKKQSIRVAKEFLWKNIIVGLINEIRKKTCEK